jgi:hypothetical protein
MTPFNALPFSLPFPLPSSLTKIALVPSLHPSKGGAKFAPTLAVHRSECFPFFNVIDMALA